MLFCSSHSSHYIIIYRYKFVTGISNTKTLFTQRLLSEYTNVCSSWSRSFPVSRIVITNNFNLIMFIKQRIPYYGLIKLFSGLVTMCSPKRQLLLGYFSCITLHCTGSTPASFPLFHSPQISKLERFQQSLQLATSTEIPSILFFFLFHCFSVVLDRLLLYTHISDV